MTVHKKYTENDLILGFATIMEDALEDGWTYEQIEDVFETAAIEVYDPYFGPDDWDDDDYEDV